MRDPQLKDMTRYIFLDFLFKLNIKSARQYSFVLNKGVVTGSSVALYVNGVKMQYAGNADFVINDDFPIVIR